MAIPIPQPHTVSVVTAAVARDAGHNAATQDYSAPTPRSIKGIFQTRSGDLIQDEEGKLSTLDGVFYTKDTGVLVDDLMTVALTGVSEKFRVSSRSVKFDIAGKLSHVEHDLSREIRR